MGTIRGRRARASRHLLQAAQRGMATEEARIIAAEVPPREAEGRGRAFLIGYLTLIAVAAMAFLALALTVDGKRILHADELVARAVQSVHQPLYGWVLTQASALGWFPWDVLSYAAVFIVLVALRLRLEAVLVVVSSLIAGGVGQLLKGVVGRMRPSPSLVHVVTPLGGYSFPSGHVIQYVTLFGFSFYLVLVLWRPHLARNVVLVVLALLVVLVGPSRVYLGQHWPSDVVGAYLFAGVWLAGTIEVQRVLKHHHPGWWGQAAEGGGHSAPKSLRAVGP